MNKKLKILFIVLIVMVLVFVGYLTYYKYKNETSENKIKSKIEMKDYRTDDNYVANADNYKDNIYNDVTLNYDFYINDESNNGRIYIDGNRKLNITLNSITKNIIENSKFNTLYKEKDIDDSVLNVYALSEDSKLYHITLIENDVDKLNITEMSKGVVVSNITDLKLKGYLNIPINSIVVVTSDGYLYDVVCQRIYDEKIINVYDEYLLYGDKTISDLYGKMITSNGNYVKVKNIIVLNETDKFEKNPNVIIITDDNRIVYIDNEKLYEYGKVISKIEYSDKIKITFTDKSKMELNGTYDWELFNIE